LIDVDFESLADMLTGVIEGGFVLARVYDRSDVVGEQIGLYRKFVASIFGVKL
jgi:hypothetical protein